MPNNLNNANDFNNRTAVKSHKALPGSTNEVTVFRR